MVKEWKRLGAAVPAPERGAAGALAALVAALWTAGVLAAPAAAQVGAGADQAASDAAVHAGADEAAVRAALQHYLDGHATGRADVMARAFAEDAHLTWIQDGELRTRTVQAYLGGMPGEPPADEAERERWIDSVEVVGDVAVARIILDYPRVHFTDYMVLHRLGGEWKIIHKAFQAQPK